MKSSLLYLSMYFLILCLAFVGNEQEVRWIWANLHIVPIILIITSLICLAIFMYHFEKTKNQRDNKTE